jgi:hypothetical protein
MNRKGITKLIVDRIGLDWTGLDWTRYIHWIRSIHRTILDLWIGLDRLILLKCDTHSEQMVIIVMGKQVRSMGYDMHLDCHNVQQLVFWLV